jgi:hypothetical protein
LGLCGADLRDRYLAGEKKNKSEHDECGKTFHLSSSGEWSINERSFEQLPENDSHAHDPGHPSLSGPLSYNKNKCQGFNFNIKVICLGLDAVAFTLVHQSSDSATC